MIWCAAIWHGMMKYHTYQHIIHNILFYCIPHGTLCYVIVHDIVWWANTLCYMISAHIISYITIILYGIVAYRIILDYIWSYYIITIISYDTLFFMMPYLFLWCVRTFLLYYIKWCCVSDPIVLHDITL